ncbi:MAG: nickel pincer cofactor biosynthesis protein LarC [bacterium]|nr:nickel pincer cofactor biosynthesis protein LarC [bacterium]
MKITYFDCFSGISGDMILGSLIDAGLDFNKLKQELNKLNIKYSISQSKTTRNGISGTSIDISAPGKDKSYTPEEILKIIGTSKLSPEIKSVSQKIFSRLTNAEHTIHNGASHKSSKKVHLHELGSIDTIIDITGAVIGLNLLKIDEIYSSPLPITRGYIKCAHGILPVPAPATIELLKNTPLYGNNISAELITPTGAAIITTIANAFGKLPEMQINSIGYGAGKQELEIPNLLRVYIGTTKEKYTKDTVVVVETNIDNMNPELYEYVSTKLFKAEALDVYLTPIQMKKNRPGTMISVITEEKNLHTILEILFSETTTLGVRTYTTSRFKLQREEKIINTKYGKIKVKIGKLGNVIKNISPEYESCKIIAEKLNIPIKIIYAEANKIIKTN